MDPEPSTRYSLNLMSAPQSTKITLFVCILVVLVLLSAFFAAAETVYTSLNRTRLKALEASGNKKAGKLLKLLENYDRLLSTIFIGNTIANITAASIATLLFVEELMSGNQNIATLVSALILTAIVLIFGEYTPKTFAKDSTEKIAISFCPVMKFLMIIFAPLNVFLWAWNKMLTKVFRLKKEASLTEDELINMIEEAESEGELKEHESKLIRSAIEFDDVDVDDIMIPRVKAIAVEDSDSMEKIAKVFSDSGFSRLPVYNDSIDQILGIIHEKDFSQHYRDGGTNIKSIIQESLCVSKNMKISDALRLLQRNKTHMAIVVDEFGGTAGLITMEDILEELVGEIWDEHDEVEVHFNKIDNKTYVIDGAENFEDMLDILGIDCNEEYESTTVGGWVTEILKRIPVTGEFFDFLGYSFKIINASAKNVLEIRATKLDEEVAKN